MSVMKTSLTIFPCVLGSALHHIRFCPGLSFATKGLGHLAALYLLLLLVARYKLPYHKTICCHLFQYLQRIPCWKPPIISFCSSLGTTLLLTERTTIDPLYLWVITHRVWIWIGEGVNFGQGHTVFRRSPCMNPGERRLRHVWVKLQTYPYRNL